MIIVDLLHPRRVALQAEKYIYQEMIDSRDGWVTNTTPIPLVTGETWRCRYAFGSGLDDSDLPCFLLWPERTDSGYCGVVDCSTCRTESWIRAFLRCLWTQRAVVWLWKDNLSFGTSPSQFLFGSWW